MKACPEKGEAISVEMEFIEECQMVPNEGAVVETIAALEDPHGD
jgi:hypothetical protein